MSKTSGYLKGSGHRILGRKRRNVIRDKPLKHMEDVHMSDISAVKKGSYDFDPALEFEYTPRELVLIAEKILLTDPKHCTEEPVWLNSRQMLDRRKREIYNGDGIPEPHIASGIYWRTHPEGRRVQSEKQRSQNRASFYR